MEALSGTCLEETRLDIANHTKGLIVNLEHAGTRALAMDDKDYFNLQHLQGFREM